MTLLDLITKINSCAAQVPNMGRICSGNIYELNEYQNVKYPAFCATQGQHSQEGDWRYYNFTLFYVDRLISDKRNASEIQSEAIDVLSNIINEIEYYGIEINGSVLYDVFTERFESECAGAFCTVTFAVMKDDICPEWYRNPIRKIRYTMVEGQQLEDSDFEITGNAKFLYNDKENGVIALEVPFKEGYINFNCTRYGLGIKTIDFFDIDTEFRLGENGKGLADNFDLETVTFPETLTYLGSLRRTNIMSCILYGNVSYIGRGTFTNCRNLNTLGYNGTMAQWNAIEKYEADLPSSGTNWHGGQTTPNLCKVICTNGEVPLCDKPGCPDCSDTGDTPSCSIDTPVCDADGVCTEDGICTEDGVCGSDCSTDTPVCDADGVCTEDGICTEDGVCGSDCASDTTPDTGSTIDIIGDNMEGRYDIELFTGGTIDPNAVYVIANNDKHVTIIDTNGDKDYGWRPIQSENEYDSNGHIIGKWATFNLYKSGTTYQIESRNVNLVLQANNSVLGRAAYWTFFGLHSNSSYNDEISNGINRVSGSNHPKGYMTPSEEVVFKGKFGYSVEAAAGANRMYLYKLKPVE